MWEEVENSAKLNWVAKVKLIDDVFPPFVDAQTTRLSFEIQISGSDLGLSEINYCIVVSHRHRLSFFRDDDPLVSSSPEDTPQSPSDRREAKLILRNNRR